ncbi:MAG: FixH family protein [Alphaproteobacteria bacterium]|nr:FixH family protein [Alphaproteobacteria bacterium]
MEEALEVPKNPKDKWIPRYFVIFFAVVALLDGIFVYMAVSTQTGVVTDNAYEKGLKFNQVLETAKNQPVLQEKAEFKDGVLRWQLADENGVPIKDAFVSARIIRPVQDGLDFEARLMHKGDGIYEAPLPLPMRGLWKAQLKSTWNQQQYQTSLTLVNH